MASQSREPAKRRAIMSTRAWIGLVLFFAFPFASIAGVYLWKWQSNRPPTHEMCVAQAERRLEAMYGDGQAEEANRYPDDYEHLRTSMISTCETYWTRSYARCALERPSVDLAACQNVERVRQP